MARCDGPLLMFNDGLIGACKRDCNAKRHHNSTTLRATGHNGSKCSFGSGVPCTGPHGGKHCMTASGKKSDSRG